MERPDYPRAIIHVDGDSFFVSCELSRRPDLRGRAVLTGGERGIATAMNPAAKALGITRATPIHMIRRQHPQVVVLEGDYAMYSLYARRMYAIVRQYAVAVEEYSIDECFADITGQDARLGMPYEEIARAIQADLMRSLAVSFSVGLGVNKATAKVASKINKPAGLAFMPTSAIRAHLADLPIGKVWGIGSATTVYLRKLGIATAGDLVARDRAWVAEYCDRPLAEIWQEFQGDFVKELSGEGNSFGGSHIGESGVQAGLYEPDRERRSSIQRTRTFYPATRDREFVWSQLSHHVEEACARLRSRGYLATRASFFLKTRDFQYLRGEAGLPEAADAPDLILRALRPQFEAVFRPELWYRAAGVSFYRLADAEMRTGGLFGADPRAESSHAVHAVIDRLSRRLGKRAVFLASSFKAVEHDGPGGNPHLAGLIYLGRVG